MEPKSNSKHKDDGVSLPEDIIFDVLVRLPAKTLFRFRCVSRAWRALISDPGFVAAQRCRAGPHLVGVFGSWPDYELRVMDMHGDVLRVFEVKESAELAPSRLELICVNRMRLGAMIVDPAAGRAFTVGRHERICWSDFSFGRANPSGAYKLLRLYVAHTTVCEVATITDDGAEPTWRHRPTPDFVTSIYSEHKATVNGVLYFMPYERTGHWNRVAAFDLENEAWMETINAPPLGLEVEEEDWGIDLTEFKETLCIVHKILQFADHLGGVGFYANIWRLIDYNKSVWVKAYKIRMPAACIYIRRPLDVLDEGRILLLNRSCSRYVLQFFNPSTEAFTDIMEMAEGFIGRLALYTGSLISS